ncbi:hypothetical protein AA0472_0711 [Acetobacter estunensis NRIC 0472]|uniref:Protein kinase domain-containing protein n=1 Tax=Acetobacter estunensis TaxID=104097 RepID=A0A967BAD8_9PROT|nr:hypothetical protein [Acetobacter estunensis]NHO53388.1 hypothetical protein [Acetobacter estunensis]GBQ22252.1 hypothetical protein AA0472_0711 [Acetobacter estunensis NRIC 0472]
MADDEDIAEDDLSATGTSGRLVIGGRYVVETEHAAPELAHCKTCVVRDQISHSAELVALAPDAFHAARENAAAFARVRAPNTLTIHAVDDSSGSVWIVCDAPPGPSLMETGGWTEKSVLERVIEPVAAALHAYKEAGLTHRAIRPDNMFDPGGRLPVRLGPAVAGPSAFWQPDRFEPLSSVLCFPAGRGRGTIADDVFALGAVAAWLLSGCPSYAADVVGANLEERFAKGSFAALAGHLSLSVEAKAMLAAMLADDPAARPAPRDLLNAAAHKGYVARKTPVATIPIQVGPMKVRTTRDLAWRATLHPKEFTDLFMRGTVERWLLHEMGMTQTAGRLASIAKDITLAEDGVLGNSVLMEIVALLEPSLPMFWGKMWFWPDALGQLVVSSMESAGAFPFDVPTTIVTILRSGKLARFGQISSVPIQDTACQQMQAAARKAQVDDATSVVRLAYVFNHFQSCLSSRCIEQRLSSAGALLHWLNATRSAIPQGSNALLDAHMTAFLVASVHRSGVIEYFDDLMPDRSSWTSDLLLLARLQKQLATGPLPGVGRQLLPHLTAALKRWRSRKTRTARGELSRLLRVRETFRK